MLYFDYFGTSLVYLKNDFESYLTGEKKKKKTQRIAKLFM
jgi:hypothetical protein